MARSVMEHSFSEVPRAEIPRSQFNRSHGHKTTFDADYLIPILVDDIIPGDTFNVNCHFFARLATPQFPIMDNMYLETFFFFVPYRLIWDNWEKMHGAQDSPADSIDYTVPVLSSGSTMSVGDLGDYFGLPLNINTSNSTDISALPFRAYRLIWTEWFRDQNLQNDISRNSGDGPDANTHTGFSSVPLKRGKRHDYFTSCLPWPQKGDSVELPLADLGTIDVTRNGDYEPTFWVDGTSGVKLTTDGGSSTNLSVTDDGGGSADQLSWHDPKLEVDFASATQSVTINALRLAIQTQRLLERDARSGTRYTEMIHAHFGVTVPDFRLQRPEFLGGGSSPINVTPVAQTTYQGTPTAEDAQGSLAAFGTVSGRHGFTKSFVEHGILIGLANVRGDITYSQGIERYWRKQTRYDFYYPVLAQIGEQSVLNSEIWSDGSSNDDDVFGYQERYSEYRYKPSRLSGLMRSDAASSLDAWHLSEDFATLPTLGSTFIESNTGTPLDRAIAVSSEPHFIADFYFDMQCARPMPIYGVPGNLDHF